MFPASTVVKRFRKSYSKNLPEYLALRNKQYPEFVYEKRPGELRNEIPVFTFHSVQPDRFEEQLRFLSSNGYQTLIADDFCECIIGNKPVPDRTVVLAFDDGWNNLESVAYPLLRRYGFQAVSFIIPGLIREDETVTRESGSQRILENTSKYTGIEGKNNTLLCTWKKIKTMHESGVIDFQSHTMYHSLIFTSPSIEDFIHPSYDTYLLNLNVPIFRTDGIDMISREAELGMPIYKNDPMFSGKKRYHDDPQLRERCIDYVRKNGGTDLFGKCNWRKRLVNLVEGYRKMHRDTGHFESEEEQRERLFYDLLESKKTIEKHLEGKIVRHLCYPWWTGSPLSVELSKKAGYMSNFWGVVEERRTRNRVGDDLYRIGRLLGDEYIFRLPGQGRKPLRKIMEEKIRVISKGIITNILQPTRSVLQ